MANKSTKNDVGVITNATQEKNSSLSTHSAFQFAERWKAATNEKADAQSFWLEFFRDVCDIADPRAAGIEFERPVISSKKGTTNWIDVFWKGNLLIEHKSAGKDLGVAEKQARDYVLSLPPALRPSVILVSDFARIRIVEIIANKSYEFALSELPDNLFRIEAIISQQTKGVATVEIEADQKASILMAHLYMQLEKNGYTGHDASVFMVRILFCLFADDTGMWKSDLFNDFLNDTAENGKDLGPRIQSLFEILDSPKEVRPIIMDETLSQFPYVNGSLFKEKLPIFFFTKEMRDALLNAATYDWSKINTTIFGSLFQSIKSKEDRREHGEHYTSELNIEKALNPLFIDELNLKLIKVWDNIPKLKALRNELGTYNILDPACGSGNFLILAYKRLRQLEFEIIIRIRQLEGKKYNKQLDATVGLCVKLEQLHGIEYEEWSS
ncbi:MAG: class I SAM-dependent DNA methyltransferase, partial [Thermoplasmata archaeon]|nr:class I SAM-dependent DNA methyltransferase [Thermoplasmata archaeon]